MNIFLHKLHYLLYYACTLILPSNAQAHVYTDRTPQASTLIRRPTRSTSLVRQLPRRRPLRPIPPVKLAVVRCKRYLARQVPKTQETHKRRPAQRRDRPCSYSKRIALRNRHHGCIFCAKKGETSSRAHKTSSKASENDQKEAQDKI